MSLPHRSRELSGIPRQSVLSLCLYRAARCTERLKRSARGCHGIHRFAANHYQSGEHGEPKGETAQDEGGGKARFDTPAHEMKKPGAGPFKGAKAERYRRQGSDHGGKYEAHKAGSDIDAQADGPASAPKRHGIKKEDAGLEGYDFENEPGIAQYI